MALKKNPEKPKSSRRKRPLPVLIIQHAEHEHPAVMRRALETQGIQSLWVHPYRGEAYPKLSQICGLISLGGPMGANDELEFPWLKTEIALIRRSVEARMPTVGVCLGGQLMARATGGKVERHSMAEVGWFPIEVNPEGKKDKILGAAGSSPIVYQWHQDTFHPSEEAVLLAGSKCCPRQAYRIGDNAYGFQFHPEADHQLVQEWLAARGVEEEIRETQKQHGSRTVQDPDTQRNRALKGEKASLKITAAIGQLFQEVPYTSVSEDLYDQFETWVTHKTLLVIEFKGPQNRPIQLRGNIASILNIPLGDFVIFKEESTLLWPIRMDLIERVLFS